jgi:hypothetical protein
MCDMLTSLNNSNYEGELHLIDPDISMRRVKYFKALDMADDNRERPIDNEELKFARLENKLVGISRSMALLFPSLDK